MFLDTSRALSPCAIVVVVVVLALALGGCPAPAEPLDPPNTARAAAAVERDAVLKRDGPRIHPGRDVERTRPLDGSGRGGGGGGDGGRGGGGSSIALLVDNPPPPPG